MCFGYPIAIITKDDRLRYYETVLRYYSKWMPQADSPHAGAAPRATEFDGGAPDVQSINRSAARAITSKVIELAPGFGEDGRRRALMDIDPTPFNERMAGTLSTLLGLRIVEASPDRVVAELTIRDELRTVGGALHGGTLMALADTVGAAATVVNLPPGAGTTTLESKTNFCAAGREGVVRAEATPLHKGKRTQVWQTRVTDESGRLLSLTTQTQMVLT
jgi:uncharacterized protein (TIGR00369 family)